MDGFTILDEKFKLKELMMVSPLWMKKSK